MHNAIFIRLRNKQNKRLFRERYIYTDTDGKIIKKSKRIINTKFRTITHGKCEWGKKTQGTSTVLVNSI